MPDLSADAHQQEAVILRRPGPERFHTQTEWLDSFHSFSFAGHYSPDWMGFGPLRVINDDVIAAGRGFGMHSHRDMEIITVMVEGELTHRDSLGNSGLLQAGEVQRMSAGTGIVHSEMNEANERCRLLQIWIEPSEDGLTPSYEQRAVHLYANTWTPVLNPIDPHAMAIQRPVHLWRANVAKGKTLDLPSIEASHRWLQVIDGEIELSGLSGSNTLRRGDGLGFRGRPTDLETLKSHCGHSDLLLFALN